MRKLKRFMSLSIALLLVVSICMTNIGTSAVYNALDEQYIDTENYTYYIDKDTLNATIIDIKAKTKVINGTNEIANNEAKIQTNLIDPTTRIETKIIEQLKNKLK